jgi:hypothetical protein
MKGASLKGSIPDVGMLHELGITHARPELPWHLVEPELEPLDESVEELRTNTDWLTGYIESRSWNGFDSLINPLKASGIEPIAVVGLGYAGTLAHVDGVPADPSVIGKRAYLAHMYRYVRATVRVYKERVSIWQIENEVNEAMLTSLFGWRTNVFGGPWWDWNFITELMETLHAAVKDEDPTALTTLNFHTDIHPNFHYTSGTTECVAALCTASPDFVGAATEWAHLLDIIAIDAYPNYYRASPVYGTDVGERIRRLKRALLHKPVIVMETGYPVAADETAGPALFQFTRERQAQYMRDALRSTIEAGGEGFFVFGAWSSTGATLVDNATDGELIRIALLGEAFRDGNASPVLSMLLQDRTFLYDRLPDLLQRVEAGWGLLEPDGTKREAFYALREEFSYIQPTDLHLQRGINFIGFPAKPVGFGEDGFSSASFLSSLSHANLIYHDRDQDRFLVTTEHDTGIKLTGEHSYIIVSPREQWISYDGTAWPTTSIQLEQHMSYELVHLPQRPRSGYTLQDLIDESGASFAIIRSGDTWRSIFPSSSPHLLTEEPSLGVLLVGPETREVHFPANPW